jgi:hypothetical protein
MSQDYYDHDESTHSTFWHEDGVHISLTLTHGEDVTLHLNTTVHIFNRKRQRETVEWKFSFISCKHPHHDSDEKERSLVLQEQ